MLKIQVTATDDREIMRLIHTLKLCGSDYRVKPGEGAEPKYTKEGKAIRWIEIKRL